MEIDVSFVSKLATLICFVLILAYSIWDTAYSIRNSIHIGNTITTNINLM